MRLRIKKHNSQLQNSSQPRKLLTVISGVLLLLCTYQPGMAQQSAATASTTIASAADRSATRPLAAQSEPEKEAVAPGKPGGEGIRIHGHWKFVVHGADGKLVSTREFENSLISPGEGDFALTFLLSGYAVGSDWAIVLCPQTGSFLTNNGTGFANNVVCTSGGSTPIAVLLPSTTGSLGSILTQSSLCGSGCVGGLQEQVNNNSSGTTTPVSFSLSGSYTASQAVTINAVETLKAICGAFGSSLALSNISPQTCSTLSASSLQSGNSSLALQQFTGTNLNTSQNPSQSLTAGQVLTVTVTISFS